MMKADTTRFPVERLRAVLGDRLQTDVPLARYTAARVGGPADGLVVVETVDELIRRCWRCGKSRRLSSSWEAVPMCWSAMRVTAG